MNSIKLLISLLCLCVFCTKVEIADPAVNPPVSLPYKFAENPDVIINEISTSNSGLVTDESNDDPDWIELYNRSDSSVNLEGYGLSDDDNDIYKWKFGNVTIGPHKYLLVFASGKNITEIKEKPIDDSLRFSSVDPWTDSVVGGGSTVRPYKYSRILATDSILNKKVISAVINQVENRPVLDWSTAKFSIICIRTFKAKKQDFSDYNELCLTMSLEKNKELILRLLQGINVNEWQAPPFVIKGTGIENDIYTIPLTNGVNGVNMNYISAYSIEAPEHIFTETKVTITDMRYRHTGYNVHTSFKLSGTERRLCLSQADSVVLDTVSLNSVPVNMSFGRCSDGWGIMKTSTPGMENINEYYTSISQVPEPVTKGGFYSEPVSVVLKSIDGGDIRYTTDGSAPSAKSKLYTGPIRIDSSTVLRFVGVKDGLMASEIQTETFFINFDTKLPVVSIAADPGAYFDPDTGMYMAGPDASTEYPYFGANFWKKDLRVPATIQLYETDRKLQFSENVETCVMGNWSRAERKKSIGVKFTEGTGKTELNYQLFPKYPNLTKFKKFVLRNNGGNCGRAMIEDPMMQSLVDDRKMDYQKYRPVVVFINGKYFGLYQLMEAANEDYLYENYGLKGDQVDFYDCGAIVQGTSIHWNNLNDYLEISLYEADTMPDSCYATVKNWMDVNNFIDYMAFEMYINNTDWPANNMRWWRERSSGKWRWLIYDTDCGFGTWASKPDWNSVNNNMLNYVFADTIGKTDYPNGRDWTIQLRDLLKNRPFREDFINRFATLLATNFAPSRVKNRIDELYSEISSEIHRDSALGSSSFYPDSKLSYINQLKAFANDRADNVFEHIKSYFSISGEYKLSVNAENGVVTVNDMNIPATYTGKYYTGVPVRLKAIPANGMTFKNWSDGNTENPRRVDSPTDISLTAICE